MHNLDAENPEVAELRAANVRLQRQLASAKAKTAELSESVYRAAKDAAVIVGRPAPKPVTKDRRKRAGEVALVHATDWQCVDGDTVVFDRDGSACRIADHPKAWFTGNKPTVRLKINGGGQLIATPDHRVMVPGGWKPVGELSRGDLVACLAQWEHHQEFPISLPAARLLGYLTADGTGWGPEQSVKFTNIRPEYLNEVETIAQTEFGITGRRYAKGRGFDLLLTSRSGGNPLRKWLQHLEWVDGFPVQMFTAERPAVAAFLNRLWAGDGCITTRGARNQPSIELACGNRWVFAQLAQSLLLKYGIRCSITDERMRGGTGVFHRLLVNAGQQNIARFFGLVGIVPGKTEACERALAYHSGRRTISEPDTFTTGPDAELLTWRRVLSVDPAGDRDTYDMEVPGKGWFVAGGVVAHNCGKISPTFSMQILEDRIRTFVRKVGKLTEIQRADHPVRECVVMLGGDMVEGVQIFPGQAWEIEATLYEQLFGCARIIEGMIDEFGGMFEHVRVVTEWGNHGRLGRRGDYPGGDNIDRMLYRIVAERFPGIEFLGSDDFYNRVVIGNYQAMLAHGDEIKSFGGNVPAFGILRKCNAWASGAIPYKFQDVYLGHFHTPMTLTLANGGRVFVTGSPESDNAYASEFCAATGIPSQRLHFIDPERGRVTSEATIWLDE